MIKAIIIDDENPAIKILKMFLEKTERVEVIASYQNASNALDEIKKLKPEVVFLDIEMPGISGMELASNIALMNYNIEIVFVTAYNQYALEAFKVNAVDYILKPISQKDIKKTVERLMKVCGRLSVEKKDKYKTRIQCFEHFEVYSSSSGEPLKWRTSKSKELLAYFFQNRGMTISKWKLCEVLWPGGNKSKVDINLHTTIYKMKKTLRNSGIHIDIRFINKSYIMNIDGIYSDVDEFQSLIDNEVNIKDNNIDRYKKAFTLYRNNYMEENDYEWSFNLKEFYRSKFIKLSKTMVEYYIKNKDYDNAVTIIKKAIKISPLEEDLHESLFNLYILINDRISFVKHYNYLKDLFKEELGIELGNRIKLMYKMINIT